MKSNKPKNRRGPIPLDPKDKRVHTVSVRVNDEELSNLDLQRSKLRMRRGQYLRIAALHRLPPTIPEVNRELWQELARTTANLNQMAYKLNSGKIVKNPELKTQLESCCRILTLVRSQLIGVKNES